ncbi:EscU/YscU/HrcU family type III secretion system export apparatus switch protein [Helicobacter heilmannii]|uniref:Flagellar biosynthesis protein FlhB n=1 Tax=Helicobacter heilmannii TaxID=35817 RepID=A0A0K2XHR4_HELHE|nr:EscU/YscU/HrcU family type III secretion system export apparatus switch protein [Helicobacter heilmannii]CCM10775.1 ABC transporter, putative [Helicobacter heilmannii ASB1.4]CRF46028.1 ABC transporter, putative [Helicobacter heilmannii]CRF47706.1 ABC transporter, putative [Helicobacter heilmannii]CRF48824.1 ABC transporter, putative [Helicobacter heilmannii]CRF51293.1 ABC transporter, putative [Helicobacter heilmannii]
MGMPKAVALAYNIGQDAAPKVVASGVGQIAKAIMEKAKAFDVPLFCNEALVNSLLDVHLDTPIPPELYASVVEVFIWLQNAESNAQMS